MYTLTWVSLGWFENSSGSQQFCNFFLYFFTFFFVARSLKPESERADSKRKQMRCEKRRKKNNRGRRRHCCLHKSLCTLRLDISAYSSVSQIPYRKRELKKGQNHREHLRVSCLNIMALMRLWLSCTAAFFSVLIIKHLSSLMLLLAFNLNTQVN